MKDPNAPDGFILFSDAVNRLANGMWGGLRRPIPVQTIRSTVKKGSIGFGRWREKAGQCLTEAAIQGKPVVYLAAWPPVAFKKCALRRLCPRETEPLIVPVQVVGRLITSRCSLPDHPIRPTSKTADGDKKLLALLNVGLIVVRESEFDAWYRSERAKGKWPSQRSRSKIGHGRPTKQTEAMRNAVLRLVREGAWSGNASITKLHNLLINSSREGVPSADTLARLVKQLHDETGEAELFRIRRSRRKRASK